MFKYVVLFSAFLLAGCAAWFSVSGISQLFMGAPSAAMAMAIALELGKLVGVSFLYRYWTSINKAIRTYMLIGSIVLMLITSVGIYGYLSAAYAAAAQTFSGQMATVESISAQSDRLTTRIQQTTDRITQLYDIRTQQEQRLNQLVGKPGFVTQQRTVRETGQQISALDSLVTRLTAQKDSLVQSGLEHTSTTQLDSKLSTFYYVAKMVGVSLDTIVRWFVLVIVFVFDPMSLALLIAYNSISGQSAARKGAPNNDPVEWVPPPLASRRVTTKETVEPKSIHLDSIQSTGTESPPAPEHRPWWVRPDGGQTIS